LRRRQVRNLTALLAHRRTRRAASLCCSCPKARWSRRTLGRRRKLVRLLLSRAPSASAPSPAWIQVLGRCWPRASRRTGSTTRALSQPRPTKTAASLQEGPVLRTDKGLLRLTACAGGVFVRGERAASSGSSSCVSAFSAKRPAQLLALILSSTPRHRPWC